MTRYSLWVARACQYLNHDIGVSWLLCSVRSMTDALNVASSFFQTYAEALMRRDAAAIAEHYAVPALIEFPESVIPVRDRTQTKEFFEAALPQYQDVTHTDHALTVVSSGPHSIWAEVMWDHHGGAPDERNMYQLTQHDERWRIAVLTPLAG